MIVTCVNNYCPEKSSVILEFLASNWNQQMLKFLKYNSPLL